MKIIVDTREQNPLMFTRYEAVRGSLLSGDYSIAGLEHLFSIERKSIADLVQSVTTGRERFERELHRLRGFDFARLLIVGREEEVRAGHYRSTAKPKAVLHSLHAFEVRYDIPVVWADTPEDAAKLIERWGFWYARETAKNAAGLEAMP
jgi:ERCC4-type nuclease